MWYIKIRESQENTEEKTYQKYHYEVWLIEIEIDFSQRLFAAACCCASVSLKGTRCRWGLLNQKKKPRRFEEPHKIGGNKKKLRVQNLNVVINFRVANKFGEGHFVARANPDLSQTFHILGQITQKHETQEVEVRLMKLIFDLTHPFPFVFMTATNDYAMIKYLIKNTAKFHKHLHKVKRDETRKINTRRDS